MDPITTVQIKALWVHEHICVHLYNIDVSPIVANYKHSSLSHKTG